MRCLFFDAIGKVRHLAIAIDSSTKPGPDKVRATLFIAAVVASRYSPDVKALYEHLIAKGKSKMGALGGSNAQAGAIVLWSVEKPYAISGKLCAVWCNKGLTVETVSTSASGKE